MSKMTSEHKRKIGEANKRGVFIPCPTCGKEVWVTPWEKSRGNKYCSKVCFWNKHRERMTGSGNPSWKGGKKKRSASWKLFVLERDNWTCKQCEFSEESIMEVDHVIEIAAGGKTAPENLQVLCPNCHRRKTNNFKKSRIEPLQPFAGK